MKHIKKFESFEMAEAEEKKPFGAELDSEENKADLAKDSECAACEQEEEEEEEEKNWNDDIQKIESFVAFNEKRKELTRKQKKNLDKNKNGIIDEEDFEILRNEKKSKSKKKK